MAVVGVPAKGLGGVPREADMNQAVHQLVHLILEGLTWFLRTLEALWVWSWGQIVSAFNISFANLPPWKIVLGIVALIVLVALFVMLFRRLFATFGRIAAAFWTMGLALFGILSFMVVAALFSRGFQWVVASVPDDFWQKLWGA
jgi:hypothetical protein